jgi:hypothetical protein
VVFLFSGDVTLNGGSTLADAHYHKIKPNPTDPNIMVGLNSSGNTLSYKRLNW